MLEGGIADKLGNEYEVRWTLVEVLRVLLGFADEIRVEPYNEHAEGLEFRITATGVDEWHQCKRRRTSGSWTLKTLSDAGVLQAFARKLAQTETKCVFVSSDPAPAFETLLEKARIAETAADFYGEAGVGKGDKVPLDELNKAWVVDADTLFDWLKRCKVEVTSDQSLRRRLEDMARLLFRTPADQVIDRLVGFHNANLGQRLTTDFLKQAIADLGIDWLAHLDETLDAKFSSATEEYLASLSPKIAGIDLPVVDLDGVVQTAIAGKEQITIVAGGAGSGKSVVLSRVIAEARERGWPVLAFRIDRYLETQTLEDLGRALLEHEGSPVASFGSRYAARPALLVIDQVDAVSEASGRSGRMRDLFFRMIDQSHHFPHMRVVAACRSYDLDRDTRLGELSKGTLVTSVTLKPLDWQAAIQPLLARLGVDEATLTERSRQVLSLPINLQLFASIAEAGERADGELSSARLFDKLMEVREQALRLAGFSWTALEAMGTIAQSMSDNQELTAPEAVLDRFQGAVGALSSAGLVTAIGRKLQFSHESFFDQTFSRHFIASGQTVYSLLTGDEQRLFRRTQVRQIFSRLRDNGGRGYLLNLREVMAADDVRYLVKDAIAYWLSEVEAPTNMELALVEGWFAPGHPLEKLAKVVLNGRQWLPILIASKALDRFIELGGDKKELAFWLLRKGAARQPDVVAAYVERWWRVDPVARVGELVAWFERLFPEGPIGQLETLYAEAVASIPATDIKEDFEANFELGSWVHKSRPLGARVLGFWLSAWMAAYPNGHPFSGSRSNDQSYWVRELAEHQPQALLEAMVPAFAEALQRDKDALAAGTLSYPTIKPPHYQHDQKYLRAVLQAFETLAVSDPAAVERLLDILGEETDVAIFVRLRAIAANGEGLGHLLVPLLARERTFKVGEGDGDWVPFAKAAAVAMPYLDVADRTKVEDVILAYRPEYEWALEYVRRFKADELFTRPTSPDDYVLHQLRLAGRDERAILKTIGPDVLSERARLRLAELERKFPGEALPEAYGVRGGVVRSPIGLEKARFMSDREWLRAIRKYAGDERHIYEENGVIGGARELASTLQARVKEQPQRFVSFLEKLPGDVNADYAEAVVSGLRESDADGALVARAIKAALRWLEGDFGRMANWTIQKHPSAGLDADVLAFLIRSAEHGSASDTAVQTTGPVKEKKRERASELLSRDRDLSSSGINGERGAAYEALSSVLWDHEETLPDILSLLERQIENEPLGSVRICMAHTINSVGKYEPDRAVQMFRRLVAMDQRVLHGHAAQHMLNWVVHRSPDLVGEIVSDLLKSEHVSQRAYGYFLESLLALLDDERNAAFVAGFAESSLRRQMAAYRGAANVASDHHGDRTASWLLPLFSDDERLVRADTVGIDWSGLLGAAQDRSAFIRAYIASPAFNNDSDHLMRALEDRVSQFPELTFEAVDRVLALSGGWTEEDKRGHYSTLHHLSRVIVELYRSVEGGSDAERKILDLFDIYLSRDVHNIRDAISAYERH